MGLATAEVLAARGAHVILACRSQERGEAAVAQLRQCCMLPGCGSAPSLEVRGCALLQWRLLHRACMTVLPSVSARAVQVMQVDLASLARFATGQLHGRGCMLVQGQLYVACTVS